MEDELHSLVEEYRDCFLDRGENTVEEVLGAWRLEKPVSSFGFSAVMADNPEQAKEDVIIFFEEHFYVATTHVPDLYNEEFYEIHVSRFKNLPEIASNLFAEEEFGYDGVHDVAGLLHGYDLKDIADFCREEDLIK